MPHRPVRCKPSPGLAGDDAYVTGEFDRPLHAPGLASTPSSSCSEPIPMNGGRHVNEDARLTIRDRVLAGIEEGRS